MLVTPTRLAKLASALVRSMLAGSVAPPPVWQPLQIGVKDIVLNRLQRRLGRRHVELGYEVAAGRAVARRKCAVKFAVERVRSRSSIGAGPVPTNVTRYVSTTDATPVRSMTADLGFMRGTVTEAGTIATSLPSPNVPSPPLRSSRNVVASTVFAFRSRSKTAVIDAGKAVSMPSGSGDNDVTRTGAFVAAAGNAPSTTHWRIVSISTCDNGGRPAGMRSPVPAVPSSLRIK